MRLMIHWCVPVLMGSLLLLAGCNPITPETMPSAVPTVAPEAETPATDPNVIVLGLSQEPVMLNALLRTQTAADVIAHFYEEGLLGVDPDGNFVPELAVEVPSLENGLVSEDGLTVTYVLRDGLTWADGAPLTCDDVVFTWEVITDPASGALTTAGYDQMTAVTCGEDARTVVVQYANFYAPFLTAFNALLPRHATGPAEAMAEWDYNWFPTGSGPFKLAEWIRGEHIILVKNENYRGDAPGVDQIFVRLLESREEGKALLAAGELDILWDLSEADVPQFADSADVVIYAETSSASERLVLNLADPALDATDEPLAHPHPLLGDVRVRQAIQAGIDKQRLVDELLFGATTVATSELNLGWAQCDVAPSAYDPALAVALLEEAGFTDADGDGVRECTACALAAPGTPLLLTLQSTTGNQLRADAEAMLTAMMAEIGVALEIANVPSTALFGTWADGAFRTRGNFDILMYTSSDGIDPHLQMFDYFHSRMIPTEANNGTGLNFSRWVNADVDAALDVAGSNADQEARRAAYQTVCEQVAADLPHIYLYDRADIFLARANISGLASNPWAELSWNSAGWDKQ